MELPGHLCLALCLLSVLSSAVSAETRDSLVDSTGRCIKDGNFRDAEDCNTCFCSKGSFPGCTLKACLPAPEGNKINGKGKCKPGTTWKEDCNTCFCTETGVAGCTLMGCLPKNLSKRSPDKFRPGGKCIPGEKWKMDDCNNCVCTHRGFASCTLNDCSAVKKDSTKKRDRRATGPDKLHPGGKCTPGEKWKMDECNNCVCTHNGFASCSLNDCSAVKKDSSKKRGRRATGSDKLRPGGKCTAGEKWKLDECNNCVCTHNGFASCSLNDCSAVGKDSSKKRGRRAAALGHFKMERLRPLADV